MTLDFNPCVIPATEGKKDVQGPISVEHSYIQMQPQEVISQYAYKILSSNRYFSLFIKLWINLLFLD